MEHLLYLALLPFRNPLKRDQPPSIDEVEYIREQTPQKKALEDRALATTRNFLAKNSNVRWTHFWHKDYPNRLKCIPNPPNILFYIGTLPSEFPTIGIVGTREPSIYGEQIIQSWLPRIDVQGVQTISGLALGIDACAHHVSCEAKIRTFAVLASGLDQTSPRQNTDLANRIIELGGGIISELIPGTSPTRNQFPRRNRIISGLSDTVWIVQGGAKSGTLHTARHALDQNRKIVVNPGSIFDPLSDLPHRLLREGAIPITSAEDLADEIAEFRPQIQTTFDIGGVY